MARQEEESTYAGAIGPKISSKSITVGTVEVSSALRRTEIEDIKANTGMDIVQKMESILVNELSQTISKQIVAKIFEMGDLNRTNSAPLKSGFTTLNATASGYVGGAVTAGTNGYNSNTTYMALSGVASSTRNGYLYVDNPLETAPKVFTGGGDSSSIAETYNGALSIATAVSSIELKFSGGQSFTGGSISLYGIPA